MILGAVVTLVWLIATATVAAVILKRIKRRKPTAAWGSPVQLIWHVLAALIVLAAVYVMLSGAWEGRLAIPSKRTPTQYFYLAHQPVAFWLLLSIEFVLTALSTALLFAASLLVLRSSWRRA